jgi:hypothetical protein
MKTLIHVFRIIIIASRFRHAGFLSALQIASQSVRYHRCAVVLDVMQPVVITQAQRVSHVPYALLPAPVDEVKARMQL